MSFYLAGAGWPENTVRAPEMMPVTAKTPEVDGFQWTAYES
ncbi:hypothetical protein [Aliamphritea spongicola]|nr:hypothetical protein [Aliamphritea spongicola]